MSKTLKIALTAGAVVGGALLVTAVVVVRELSLMLAEFDYEHQSYYDDDYDI